MINAFERLQTLKEHKEPLLAATGSQERIGNKLGQHPLQSRPSRRLLSNRSSASSYSSTLLDDDEGAPDQPSPLYTCLWWLGIVIALVLPEVLAKLVNVGASLSDMHALRAEVQQLCSKPAILVPPVIDSSEDWGALDSSLIAWQASMQSLYTRTIALKVLDAASETNLEFSLNTGEEFEPKRDYVILAYLLMSLAVYFTDNIHLAVILLHFNIFNLAVCFRVKALDDAFSAALQPLTKAIEAMFLLPMSASHEQEQMFLLTKMQAMKEHWEDQSLGVSFSVPLMNTVLSINIGLLISIVAATTVRCLNVVVCGVYPHARTLDITSLLFNNALGGRAMLARQPSASPNPTYNGIGSRHGSLEGAFVKETKKGQ